MSHRNLWTLLLLVLAVMVIPAMAGTDHSSVLDTSLTDANFMMNAEATAPVASFTGTPTTGTAPLVVQFTDASTDTPTAWAWDFNNDGTIDATTQNVTYTYTTAGTYTVNLTATNAAGSNTSSQTGLVTVTSGGTDPLAPVAAFNATPRVSATVPMTVQFHDRSTLSPTAWNWEFGDGGTSTEQNPSHTYTALGNYTVNLTVTNSYGSNTSSSMGYTTILAQQVVPDFSPTNIYVSNPAGVRYDYPNGAQADYVYVPNTYYLYFDTAGGGLNPLHISPWNVFNPPTTTLWGATTTTRNQSDTFYVTYTGGQSTYTDGILMLAVNGTIPDDFSVHINSSGYEGGIDETFHKKDFLYGPQISKPSSSSGYPIYYGQNMSDTGNTFQLMFVDLNSGGIAYSSTQITAVNYSFTNLTSFAAFNVYSWNIDDNHGTGIHMTNDVSSSGYMVLGIPAAPVANFTAASTTTDFTSPVYFTDTSLNTPQSWYWEFGDGSTSTEQNPLHTYTAYGTYTVNLTVTNLKGTNTISKAGYVSKISTSPPLTAFSANVTSGISPCPVQFTDASTGTVTSWLWDFGDGSTATTQNATHWYAPGTFTVNLTATNGNGSNSSVKTSYITVASNGRANQFVNPGFETGDMTGWTPVSGGTVTTESAHTGTYSEKLYGISVGSQQVVDLTNVSSISFWGALGKSAAGARIYVFIDDTQIGTTGTVSGSRNRGVWKSYSVPVSGYSGVHTVKFLQTLSGGSFCMYLDDVIAMPAPVASFTAVPLTGQAPLAVQFNDTSARSPSSWAWDFGDSGTSTVQNATHTYTTAGTYTVNLTATNDGGSDTATYTGYITVTSTPATVPVAAFSANTTTGTAPLAVTFTDASANTPTSWAWNFGDGSTATTRNATHTYKAGIYTVSLNATNAAGSNTTTKTGYISVFENPADRARLVLPTASLYRNTATQLPVQVMNSSNGTGISFDLAYDPAVIRVDEVTLNQSYESGSNLAVNATPGMIRLSFTRTDGINIKAPVPVFFINTTGIGAVEARTSLNASGARWSDGTFNYRQFDVVNGTLQVESIRGDFNGNDFVDIGDVARVAYMVVEKTPSILPGADFNNNGRIDVGDASKIAWYLVGKITEL